MAMEGEGHTAADISDPVPCFCSKRWIMGYMGVLFGTCLFLIRVDFSMAMVCMVKTPLPHVLNATDATNLSNKNEQNGHNLSLSTHTGSAIKCEGNIKEATGQNKNAEFIWSKSFQSLMLSVFYIGCVVSQIPGGWLASRFGGKRLVTYTMLISAACTLLTPVLVRANPYSVLAVRIVMGLASGVVTPAWFDLLGRWIPPLEKTKFTAFFFTGQYLGTILAFTTSGVLCSQTFDNGWPLVFYVHGSAVLLFTISWHILVFDNPNEHKRISKVELSYLTRSVPVKTKDSHNIPWKPILTSRQVWILYVTHMCESWTFFTLLICLPMFLNDVLKLHVQSNGLYSSLPYVTLMFAVLIAGYTADLVQTKGIMTTTATRRTYQVTGFIGSGGFIVLCGFISCEQTEFVILCVCACNFFFGIGEAAGYSPLSVDIAPKYASIIFSVSNTLANIVGFVAPIAVGYLTPNGSRYEWRKVFYICAGLDVFGALIFGSMATAKPQPWSKSNIEIIIEPDGKMYKTVVTTKS